MGGILSPIIFTIYGAELEEWTKNLTIFRYADDTSSSTQGKNRAEVVSKLGEDGKESPKYMTSNGLVANPTKTTLPIMKNKEQGAVQVTVRNATVLQKSIKTTSKE